MKLLFSIFFFCVMTLPCLAQDSLKTASTLSFKPLVGLSLLNGARAGLQVQYNDFIAIEGGLGIIGKSTLSYGVIVTPFGEKSLSFHLYDTYYYNGMLQTLENGFSQFGIGWTFTLGYIKKLRITIGLGNFTIPQEWHPGQLMLALDFTVIFDDVNIRL
ncbi:MAG: hypothetical protein IPK11_15990 [Ignavibacteria bacterium]|nr:hypothetical protein [Ignavibacteria bacterium]